MFKFEFEYQLHDNVKMVDGCVGTITHCGIDGGGQIYLVQWKKEDGSMTNGWYRPSEIFK